MTKPDRITVRLAAEDRLWAEGQAEELGLELSDVVRMLIRQARRQQLKPVTEYAPAQSPAEPDGEDLERQAQEAAAAEQRRQEQLRREAVEQRKRALLEQLAALDDGQEPSDDDANAYGPDDEPEPELTSSSDEIQVLLQQSERAMMAQQQSIAKIPYGKAFSATRPVGVSRDVAGGYDKSDAVGNIVRHNYAHLGFRGS